MKPDHVISIRQFRQNSGGWIDLANSGETILLDHHGKDGDCYLVPKMKYNNLIEERQIIGSANRNQANIIGRLNTKVTTCYRVIAIESVLLAGLLASLLWGW